MRSWRRLAEQLMGWIDYKGSEGERKLDAIERHHVADDVRLRAVVEAFLLGEGRHQPSWRMLIHQLHRAEETDVAEKIKTNAEPHQGEWVSVWRGRRLSSHIMYAPNVLESDYCVLARDTTVFMLIERKLKK